MSLRPLLRLLVASRMSDSPVVPPEWLRVQLRERARWFTVVVLLIAAMLLYLGDRWMSIDSSHWRRSTERPLLLGVCGAMLPLLWRPLSAMLYRSMMVQSVIDREHSGRWPDPPQGP